MASKYRQQFLDKMTSMELEPSLSILWSSINPYSSVDIDLWKPGIGLTSTILKKNFLFVI